jgi:spore maturation protein CgeB
MRILATVAQAYALRPEAVQPMYRWFTDPLRKLGHEVEHFDHVQLCREVGPGACGAAFEHRVTHGRYDLVLYQTSGDDLMARESIERANRHVPVVAWSGDDQAIWGRHTRDIAALFSHVVTTSRDLHQAHRGSVPNLVLSQWGCLDTYANFGRAKDFDFTFVGRVTADRVADCRRLRQLAGLRAFGLGAMQVNRPLLGSGPCYDALTRWLPSIDRPLEFKQVHEIWNRSKVSYAPLGSAAGPAAAHVNARVFEMGTSGTMMLCRRNGEVERFYEPGKEFVSYDSAEECADKAKFYLRNEAERSRVADAYHRRTRGEHLWEHRFMQLFRDIGVGGPPARVTVRKVA